MQDQSPTCQRIAQGKPAILTGPGGRAVIARSVEGFTATVYTQTGRAFRRFSLPSAALHWAWPQIKPSRPTKAG
jgi:hypothetical protein